VKPFCPLLVNKPVAVGINGVIVVDLKSRPRPSTLKVAFRGLDDVHSIEQPVKASWVSEVAQVADALKRPWSAHDAQGKGPLTVGDVFPFEEQKRQTKHVVTVKVGDQNRAQVGGGTTCTPQSNERRWRCIDEVLTVHQRHGMEAPPRQEGIPGPKQVDAGGHVTSDSTRSTWTHRQGEDVV